MQKEKKNNVGSCCVRFHVPKRFKLCTTTRNSMQQGVQTGATCNIQQFWKLLASNVASVCTGLYRHEYGLSYKPLSAVEYHKHLSVWLDSSLSWDHHINYICGKVNKVLGLILRIFGQFWNMVVSSGISVY